MNGKYLRYPEQPDDEIWFYDKNRPYYELTNFFYNQESRNIKGVVGQPQYPLKTKLPIQFGNKDILDQQGRVFTGQKYFYCSKFKMWEGRKCDVIEGEIGRGREFNWPTAEHLFQVCKFTNWGNDSHYLTGLDGIAGNGIFWRVNHLADRIEKIANQPDPNSVREEANKEFWTTPPVPGAVGKWVKGIRNDWSEKIWVDKNNNDIADVAMRLRAMRWAVQEKFTQHSELRELLWKTGDKYLVEHTSRDSFWGDGGNGSGENWLGKILMEVRQEIINEEGNYDGPVELEPEIPEPTAKNEKNDLIEENIREIRDQLSAAGISNEQAIEILGNSWETNYRMSGVSTTEAEIENSKKAALAAINEWITNNSNRKKGPNGPGSPNQKIPTPPTPSEEERIKTKLDTANASDNSDDIINALQEELEKIITSPSDDLQQSKKTAEEKLKQADPAKLQQIIEQEIQAVLSQNGIQKSDLPEATREKYDQLNSDNSQATRDEIVQEIGKTALTNLIAELDRAIQAANRSQIESKSQALQQFSESQISYRKNAVALHQSEINQALAQARHALQNTPTNNNNNDQPPFFRLDNPLVWISGLALVGLIAIVLWAAIRSQPKREVEE